MEEENRKEMYARLKADADRAFEIWQLNQTPMDWDWFMICEQMVADYALKHEEEIFDD